MLRRFRPYPLIVALALCAVASTSLWLSSCASFNSTCRKHRLVLLSGRDSLPVYPFTIDVGEIGIEQAWASDVLTEVEGGKIVRHEEECWAGGLDSMVRDVMADYFDAISRVSTASSIGPGGWTDYVVTGRIVEMVAPKGEHARVAMRLTVQEGNPAVRADRAIFTRLYVDSAAPRLGSFMDLPVAYSHAVGRIARRVLRDIDSVRGARRPMMAEQPQQFAATAAAPRRGELRLVVTASNRRGTITVVDSAGGSTVHRISGVTRIGEVPAATLSFTFEEGGARIPGTVQIGPDPKRCELRLFRNGVLLTSLPTRDCERFRAWRQGLQLQ